MFEMSVNMDIQILWQYENGVNIIGFVKGDFTRTMKSPYKQDLHDLLSIKAYFIIVILEVVETNRVFTNCK